jgi:signal transduction histidine kinase
VRLAGPRVRSVACLAVDLAAAPMVRAPSGFLTQIAVNLINNAADALGTQARGQGRIEVRLRSAEGRVQLEVSDDGPGISPRVVARLFQPHVTTKPEPTALGMGLAICRALVRRCGGEISASSMPGQGTTFHVTLPAWSAPRG